MDFKTLFYVILFSFIVRMVPVVFVLIWDTHGGDYVYLLNFIREIRFKFLFLKKLSFSFEFSARDLLGVGE